MRYTLCILAAIWATAATAQIEGIGFIAPEGKIINYRTLCWNDFQDKEEKKHADELRERNLQARAYVCPSIYVKIDSGERMDNGRVTFKFKVKCAFQSRAFVRESTKKEHSNYVLIHEQDHYDIALAFANKLQSDLSTRDYSEKNYDAEIDKLYNDLIDIYHNTQEKYDNEVNPEGKTDVPKQQLWDMRIKKCLDNNNVDFLTSTEELVTSVKTWGQTVKRIPGEDLARFLTRVRPLYTELTDDLAKQSIETAEWSLEKTIIAFYLQRYYVEVEGEPTKDCSRLVAYAFTPTAKDTYRRVFIDTFCYNNTAPKLGAVFFANADSDEVKELVIMTTTDQKDKQGTGKHYATKLYDNIRPRVQATRVRRLRNHDALESGFDGTLDGKPQKAKYKTEKDITEYLGKMGSAK